MLYLWPGQTAWINTPDMTIRVQSSTRKLVSAPVLVLKPSILSRLANLLPLWKCYGCPPETYQVTDSAKACPPTWIGGCFTWHQELSERFYAQSASDKNGNWGPRKAWHSKKGKWPSYHHCNNNGGFGIAVTVKACFWEGPNPAWQKYNQHMSAEVDYQTCSGTKYGPVCKSRYIRFNNYPDGHTEVHYS